MSRLHGSKRGPRGRGGLHRGDFCPSPWGGWVGGGGWGWGLPAGLSLQEPGVAAPQN